MFYRICSNFNSPITDYCFTNVRNLAILVQKCINIVEMHISQCSVLKNLLSRKNSYTLQNKTAPSLIPKNRAQTLMEYTTKASPR